MSGAVGSDAHDPRGQAPIVPIPRELRPYQGRRAGVVSRVVANTVDFVIVVLVVAGGYLGVSAVLFLWSPPTFSFPQPSTGLLLVAGGVVTFAYFAISWLTTGRTYGDHLLGLRVVNYRGERLRLTGAAARAALCVVFPIGLFYALISRANRSVQDVVFRTSVVYDWGPHRPGTGGRERVEIVDASPPARSDGGRVASGLGTPTLLPLDERTVQTADHTLGHEDGQPSTPAVAPTRDVPG